MIMNVNGKRPEKSDEITLGGYEKTPLMLINEISKLTEGKISRAKGNEVFLLSSHRLIISELAHKDGTTQLDIVKATHLKAPTVSVCLQRLEDEGYITREKDKYDMRSVRVFLSEKGKELCVSVRRRIDDEEKAIMAGISERQLQTTLETLMKMRKNIIED